MVREGRFSRRERKTLRVEEDTSGEAGERWRERGGKDRHSVYYTGSCAPCDCTLRSAQYTVLVTTDELTWSRIQWRILAITDLSHVFFIEKHYFCRYLSP